MAEAVTGKAESGVALPRSLVLDRDLSLFALYLIHRCTQPGSWESLGIRELSRQRRRLGHR